MDTTSLPSNRAADALGNSTAEPSPQNAMGVAQFLHLLAAYSLVIAQPVFDRLKDNTGYLTQQAMSPAVIVIGTLLISLLVPVLLFAACVVVHRFSPWHSRALLLVILGILFALGENLINQAFAGWLVRHQPRVIISGIFYLSVAVLTAWWLIRQYQRKAWISQFLSLASISVILFPASLLTSGPMQPVLFPDQLNGLGTPLHAAHPQPIVWIVFDGLAGMAILGSDRQIDAVRYPNFAKLAGMSTYYRNASTVHPRTDAAVPAMLCSTYPIKQSMPVLVNHPDNLFTLLIRTQQFDPVVFEPYTRLCPVSLKHHPHSREPVSQLAELLSTCSLVYAKTALPADVVEMLHLPAIPRAWFRLPDKDTVDRNVRYGSMIYPWDVDREIQIDHFIDCLNARKDATSERKAFSFLHVMLPHYPWCYLPDGRRYAHNMAASDYPLGAHGDIGEDWGPDSLATDSSWRRYLLQLQYADQQLGRILQTMESLGTLDESLLIVTADHGESFIPGTSRRTPSTRTLPEILPVPLFIKFPGQKIPRLTDRNVETIDILPTLADVIGLELPMPIDGESLLDESAGERLRKTMFFETDPIVVEGSFPQRFEYVDMIAQVWGSGSDDRLWKPLVLPELIGKSVQEFKIDTAHSEGIAMTWGASYQRSLDPQIVPCLFQGEFTNLFEKPSQPFYVAIAVDGLIAGITRTLDDEYFFDDWSVLIDPRFIHGADPDIQIFQMTLRGDSWTLIPCVEQ